MPIVSKVGVASVLDQMLPFGVQILGTTLHVYTPGVQCMRSYTVLSIYVVICTYERIARLV